MENEVRDDMGNEEGKRERDNEMGRKGKVNEGYGRKERGMNGELCMRHVME